MSHYIRLDTKSRIIKGFSDAFEQPLVTDTCILDDPMQNYRQFMLNDEYNPSLFNGNMPLYKYINNQIELTTDNDNSDFIQTENINTANTVARQFLSDTDWKVIRQQDQLALGITTSLTDEEYKKLLTQRQQARTNVANVD